MIEALSPMSNIESVKRAYSRNRMNNMGTQNNTIHYKNMKGMRNDSSDIPRRRLFNLSKRGRQMKLNQRLMNNIR